MENQEKVIDKIRKVLELSKNNPSKEEAQAAAVKAQKLMAEYHIEMADIEGVSDIDEISEETYTTHPGGKWKIMLSHIIAKNFRCMTYRMGSHNIVFYGHETDTKIACEVFEYLYVLGTKLATKEYNANKKAHGTGTGVMNSWYSGYLDGISSVLGKQCTALMIVTPKDVEEGFEELNLKKRRMSPIMSSNNEIYSKGYEEGKSAIQQRSIEEVK